MASSGGIGPLSSLPQRSSSRRVARLASSGGIGPLSPLPSRLSPVTLPFSVVTPNHSPSGAAVSQLVLSIQPGPFVAWYRASTAARSVSALPCAAASATVSRAADRPMTGHATPSVSRRRTSIQALPPCRLSRIAAAPDVGAAPRVHASQLIALRLARIRTHLRPVDRQLAEARKTPTPAPIPLRMTHCAKSSYSIRPCMYGTCNMHVLHVFFRRLFPSGVGRGEFERRVRPETG